MTETALFPIAANAEALERGAVLAPSFNADGLIAPANPGQKQGTKCVVMANVQNGAWNRVEPSSGFDCSGTYFNVPLSEVTKS